MTTDRTAWTQVNTLLLKGYKFEIGPHYGKTRGFWARFLPANTEDNFPVCDACSQAIIEDTWETAGHALTIPEAIIMAAKLASNKAVIIPNAEDFDP